MKLNDELRIGEVSEVSGKQIKAGIYYEKNTEFLNFNGASGSTGTSVGASTQNSVTQATEEVLQEE